ncbi:unnamed protein product [Albugo candida]|uniref:Uncharacterized protein n=1 Tax=Albugo candida TaxID=65357 RepID=A0A024GMB9_9STRA|nr:unnamed protein product [Albugo candida]|eukprot:CCI47687.1 unnamed protein product [Albugo candida]
MDFKSLRKDIIERLEEENRIYTQEYTQLIRLLSSSEQNARALQEKLQSKKLQEKTLKQVGALHVQNEQLLKERACLKAMIYKLEKDLVKKEKDLVESKAALSITFSLIVGLVSEWTMYFLEETQKSLTLMQNKSDQDAQSLQSYRDSIHLLENELIQLMAPIK